MDGLVTTLADSVAAKGKEMADALDAGVDISPHEEARQVLHRLISSTNRCMHKGFPEMLTYLLRKKMYVGSHSFVHCSVAHLFASFITRAIGWLRTGEAQTSPSAWAALRGTPRIKAADYEFRPVLLHRFPLYFFLSGCTARTALGPRRMNWVVLADTDGNLLRQDSYKPTPEASKSVPELCLLDGTRRPIHTYTYYAALRTDEPWAVPILHMKLPRLPDETSSWEEKGHYALFLLWLFRPHRGPRDLVPSVTAEESKPQFEENIDTGSCKDQHWRTIYEEFCRWREVEVREVASRTLKRVADGENPPAFDTPEWWACLVEEKLRNWDACTRKHHDIVGKVPQNLDCLPEASARSPCRSRGQ